MASGKPLPGDTANDLQIRRDFSYDEIADEIQPRLLDDEYQDPRVLIATSRPPLSRLQAFSKEIRLLLPTAKSVNRDGMTLKDLVRVANATGRVNPEEIVQRLQASHITPPGHTNLQSHATSAHIHPFDSRYTSQMNIPKYKIPEEGAPGDTVFQMIRDELDLDGKPNLNLASFVGTFMEPNATQLMQENLAKNLSDADEYPAMMEMHQRCISIISHLWGVQPGEKAIGSATTGSSEAIHLGGLAMKRRWQQRRKEQGKDTSKPNIIMGSNAQVALEKFARYFDVEARILPVTKKSHYRLDPALIRENIDENTIGIFVILGSTYTGHYEPVEEISKILDKYQEESGNDIPIHVDAASGGFIAPFTHAGVGDGAKWNFELPRVKSINTSGHKYGLVYAGLGWIIWRDESYLPEDLIFELHYLGGTEKSFTLNFSRPGAQVIVQYYNLIHLGFEGYRCIMENCMSNARLLAQSLEATEWYTVVSDIHRPAPNKAAKGAVKSAVNQAASAVGGGDAVVGETSADYVAGLPVVSFRLTDDFKKTYPHIKQETISLMLRARGWIIPNYPLPPNEEKIEILRVVVRESMTFDLLERLLTDISTVTETLMENDEIDLQVLKHHHRRNKVRVKGDVEKEEKHKKQKGGAAKELGKEVRKMEDGIHRAVC
ncbi:glutamate decarboxylase [Colletotrichum karsti]|uniref:Glutamate decarboxylase n=1 Tax=Colletotrichum karsti TaxID=1095194 RepID=A0A9P6I9R3_9PEZI|nr:glutamate decarboxylase [Colletotrichum karsti]KAF9879462.1 glutamate decarboxylase [Colletotrichum karsti]